MREKVPTSIRAQGPEAFQKFHQGKDQSHIVPRALGTQYGRKVFLVEYHEEPTACRSCYGRGPNCLAQTVLVYEETLATLALTLRPMLVGGVISAVFATLIAVLD